MKELMKYIYDYKTNYFNLTGFFPKKLPLSFDNYHQIDLFYRNEAQPFLEKPSLHVEMFFGMEIEIVERETANEPTI